MEREVYEEIQKLAPFVLRAHLVETGRQRLLQNRNKLAFLLVTEDLSENSRDEALKEFPCPIYQALTSEEVESLFNFHGTKMVGFRRNALSGNVQRCLKGCHIVAKPLAEARIPDNPAVVLFGCGAAGSAHAHEWEAAGVRVVGLVEETQEKASACASALKEALGHDVEGSVEPEALLKSLNPVFVDVSLPTELHYAGCHLALRLGCHVLCEKPFLDGEKASHKSLLKQRESLVGLAARHKRLLGTHGPEAVRGMASGRVFYQVATA